MKAQTDFDEGGETFTSTLPKLKSIFDVLNAVPPTWQVRNLIPRGAVIVAFGRSQVAKTFMALEMAACVALSLPFLGMKVRQGSVVYLMGEGGAGLTNRVKALSQKYPDLEGAPISFWTNSILVTTEWAGMVLAIQDFEKEKGQVGLVVIDTLSQTIVGNEDKAEDMAAYIRSATAIAQHTSAPVLVLHHPGKDEDRGPRGSSSLTGNVDVVIKLVTDENGVRTGTTRSTAGGKMRDGRPMDFQFRLLEVDLGFDEDGEQITTCVVKPVNKVTEGGTAHALPILAERPSRSKKVEAQNEKW